MKIRSLREYREFFTYNIKEKPSNGTYDPHFIGTYYKELGKKTVNGFFELFHGHKPDISGHLPSVLKIAEDGQAIYEFIQNAVDCEATSFWIYYTEDYFLAINNGHPFKQNEIESLINIAQSDKRNLDEDLKCDKIGRFGIGFKLVHRLCGENDGTDELTTLKNETYSGPIIFSWSEYSQLSEFIDDDAIFEQQELHVGDLERSPWLFKILLTNFPVAPGEKIKDLNYNEFEAFPLNEINDIRSFIKEKLDIQLSDKIGLNQGSAVFIKLGNNKFAKLQKENAELTYGIQYAMNTLKKLENITINETKIERSLIKFVDYRIEKNDPIFERIKPEYAFCPIKVSVGFHNNAEQIILLKSTPNFFKYFPLGDEVDQLAFIVHSDAFDIEANRRRMHDSARNVVLLTSIKDLLISDMNEFCESGNYDFYYPMFLSLLLSDSKQDDKTKWITDSFTIHLQEYIKNRVPTIDNRLLSKDNVIIKSFMFQIDLNDIGFNQKGWFRWSDQKNKEILYQSELKEKLGLEKWYLRNLIVEVDMEILNTYLGTLNSSQYEQLINELNKEPITDELKTKLNTLNWILSEDNLLFSFTQIQSGKLWIAKNFDSEIQKIFFAISGVRPHKSFFAIQNYVLKVNPDYFTRPAVIIEYLNSETGRELFRNLAAADRLKLVDYLYSFDSCKSSVLNLPFAFNKNGVLCIIGNLTFPETLILREEYNSIILLESENTLLKVYEFATHLQTEKNISHQLHSNGLLLTVLQSGVKHISLPTFYKSLIEIYQQRDQKLTDNSLSGNLSATVNQEEIINWASNNSIYYWSGLSNLSISEYETFLGLMDSFGTGQFIHQSGLEYLEEIGRSDSSLKPSQLLRTDIPISNEEFESFLELSDKIGVGKVFDELYVSQNENEIKVFKKSKGESIYNYLELDPSIKEDLDLSGVIFKPFYSKLSKEILNQQQLLNRSSFGAFIAHLAKKVSLADSKYIYNYDVKTKLVLLKKLDVLNYLTDRIYSEDDAEVKIIYLWEEMINYATKNKDIAENAAISKDIFDEVSKFRLSTKVDGVDIKSCNFQNEIVFEVADGKKEYKFLAVDLNLGKKDLIELFEKFRRSILVVGDTVFKKVFKPYVWKPAEVYRDITGANQIATIYQSVFIIIYSTFNKIKLSVNLIRPYTDLSEEELLKYMNYAFCEDRRTIETVKNWPGFIDEFKNNCLVKDLTLARESEKMPPWMLNWVADEPSRLLFLEEIGLFGKDSSILLIRKKIKEGSYGDEESLELIEISTDWNRLYYTVQWMANNNFVPKSIQEILFTQKLIHKPYLYFGSYTDAVAILTCGNGDKCYKWVLRSTANKFYRISNIEAEYIETVKTHITANSFFMVDEIISHDLDKKLGIVEVFPVLKVNDEWLVGNTKELIDSTEIEWALENNLKLKEIITSFALYDLYFENEIIGQVQKSNTFNHDGVIYFMRRKDLPLPFSVEDEINDKQKNHYYNKLFKKKGDTKPDDDKGSDLEKRYSSTFEKAIKDRLDLSKEDQKSIYDSAFEIGCGSLLEKGYTFPDGDEFISTFSIKLINTQEVEESFIFSSAVNGLLFLAPQKLDEMNRMNHKLIVIYPGTEIRQFDSVTNLINDPANKYLLLRTQNTIDVGNFMKIVKEKLSDNSHFIFATSDIMRKSLFSIQQGRKGKKNVNDTVKDEDNLLWN